MLFWRGDIVSKADSCENIVARKFRLGRFAVVSAVATVGFGTQVWASPIYSLTQISPSTANFGNTYESASNASVGSIYAMNASGEVLGSSNRYLGGSTQLGNDLWEYNGTSTVILGFNSGYDAQNNPTGVSYTQTSGKQVSSVPFVAGPQVVPLEIDASGDVAGTTQRWSAGTTTQLGQDAWFYPGAGTKSYQVGFTGAGYVTSTLSRSSSISLLGNGGVVGTSTRYSSANTTSYGTDAWLATFSGGAISQVQLGLTGAQNGSFYTAMPTNALTGTESTTISTANANPAINQFNNVAGVSTRYASAISTTTLGADAWYYNGTSTVQIGLTGAGYTTSAGSRTSAIAGINNANQVFGTSSRYSSTSTLGFGQQPWCYTASSGTTVMVGLSTAANGPAINGTTYTEAGTGTFAGSQSSTIIKYNDAGQAAGIATRYSGTLGLQDYNSAGDAPFFFNGSTSVPIGLTNAMYYSTASGPSEASVQIDAVTANGSVVGANAIALVPTNAFGGGSDIWEYTGGATKVINLTSPEVTGSGSVLRQATFVGANASGEVIGSNVRYNGGTTSLGNAGWLFDGTQTVEISFPSASSTGTEITVPQAISPTGAVVGYYDLYSGGTTFLQHAFEWTELNGFTDLGSSILNGLNAEGWQALATATLTTGSGLVGLPGYDADPLYIAGVGTSSSESASGALYEAVQVPEAGSTLAISSLLAGAALTRVRRRA
jgi:hypothetical protein